MAQDQDQKAADKVNEEKTAQELDDEDLKEVAGGLHVNPTTHNADLAPGIDPE